MTLEEAIAHYKEVVITNGSSDESVQDCQQLVDWLIELKELKSKKVNQISEDELVRIIRIPCMPARYCKTCPCFTTCNLLEELDNAYCFRKLAHYLFNSNSAEVPKEDN